MVVDKSLEKVVFTKGPFDRIYEKESLPFMVISEPLMGTGVFDEKAWEDLCKTLGKLYGQDDGDLFILGGLMGENADVNDVKAYLDKVPKNVKIHVMYNAVDEGHVKEAYSTLVEKVTQDAKTALKEELSAPQYIQSFMGEEDDLSDLSSKSKLPKSVKRRLMETAEHDYTEMISSLGDNIEIHGKGEHKITLKKNGHETKILMGANLTEGKKRNKSSSHLTRLMHEKGLHGEEIDVAYVIDGNCNNFRFKPNSPQSGVTPRYEISVGPFSRTDEGGFSSGAMLIDHAKTTRVTSFNLGNIKLEDNTLNAVHISDSHDGKGNMRMDLARAIAYVMDNDQSVELVINTGDDYQSINYRGASTEGMKRARIDDQFVSFWSRYLPSFMEVVKRSRLKTPVIHIKGNHEKPLDEYGVNLTKIATFMVAAMEMLDKGEKEKVRFLPTDFMLEVEGEDCEIYNFPMRSLAVGHEGYGEHEFVTKDGESYGKAILAHKLDAEGEKRDPTSRTMRWLHETGRGTGIRMVYQGHSHIPMSSNVYDGIDITVGASMEAKNRAKKHSWQTDSSYGIKTGFMEPVPGAWKKYIPKEGAITNEFLSETYLREVYDTRVKDEVKKNVKRVPDDVKDTVF